MTAAQPRSYITQAMRQWVGTESLPLVSPPIELSEVRRTAIAVYWPEVPPRLYWDQEYAKKTSWSGIIAPQEHNPFAWMVGRAHIGPQPERTDDEQARIEESRNLRPPGAPTRYLFGSIDPTLETPEAVQDSLQIMSGVSGKVETLIILPNF